MPSNTFIQEMADAETTTIRENGKLVGCMWKDGTGKTFCVNCMGEGVCGAEDE